MGTKERILNGRNDNPYRRSFESKGEQKDRFLIVCEGEKTEPNYFKAFRVSSAVVHVVGEGAITESLVKKTIIIRDERKADGDDYDQVWCVFDRDSHPPQGFNNAFFLADREKIKIAYSNQSFELWYILHFQYLDTGINRDQYIKILNGIIPGGYKKNSKDMYEQLLKNQSDAIRNSERLLGNYSPVCPEKNDPSTTVHELVRELNRFI